MSWFKKREHVPFSWICSGCGKEMKSESPRPSRCTNCGAVFTHHANWEEVTFTITSGSTSAGGGKSTTTEPKDA